MKLRDSELSPSTLGDVREGHSTSNEIYCNFGIGMTDCNGTHQNSLNKP